MLSGYGTRPLSQCYQRYNFVKKAGPHLEHSFICLAPKKSYLSRRTYSETLAEFVEACGV